MYARACLLGVGLCGVRVFWVFLRGGVVVGVDYKSKTY